MTTVEIIICVILGLGLLRGLWKGFFKQIFSIVWIVCTLAIAFFGSKYITQYAKESGYEDKIVDKTENYLLSKGSIFETELNIASSTEQLEEAFAKLKLPAKITEMIQSLLPKVTEDTTIAGYLSPTIASIIISVISFLGICLLLGIFSFFIGKWLKDKTEGTTIGFIDSFLGAIIGLAKSAVIILIGVTVLSLLINLPLFGDKINDFVIQQFNLDSPKDSLGSFVWENNILLDTIKKLL